MKLIKISFALSFVLFITACNNDSKNTTVVTTTVDSSKPLPVVENIIIDKDSLLSATGKEILSLLKNKQYDSLTNYFSPKDSVHFSPYGFIGSGAQTLTAADFKKILAANKKINWGDYDGSGDPINLTLKEYFAKFVYNADFLKAEKTSIDTFIAGGNSLNNLKDVYKNIRFIEYYFSGFDKKFDGMDWTSLRLVFKEESNRYFLVAVVHDQWTI